MPRRLIDTPIVTYPKRIVYHQDPPSTRSWGQIFFETLGIQLFAFLVTTALTAGVGAIAGAYGLSQFAISGVQTSFAFTTNFAIAQINDVINDNVSGKNTLLNLLFAANELGRLGRGYRAQKVLNMAQQQGILSDLGIKANVKNYYQIAEKLKMTETITKGKVILRFGETVTDNEILQSISVLVDEALLNNVKKMTTDNLKELVDIQKIIKKINPNLVPTTDKFAEKKIDPILRQNADISYKEFLKLNDYESLSVLSDLIVNKKVPRTLIAEINRNRLAYQFQNQFISNFMRIQKQIKKTFNYVNPFYWLNKSINAILQPISNQMAKLGTKLAKPLTNAVQKSILQNYIPCQPQSYLLAFRFEPIGLAGEGFLTIKKKPYVWKKQPRTSNYSDVRVYTTLLQVEQFASAESQNTYYADNWKLGKGYRQEQYRVLNLIAPKIASIVKQNVDFFNTVRAIPLVFKKVNINDRFKADSIKSAKRTINKIVGVAGKSIPFGSYLTPHFINLFTNAKFRKQTIQSQVNRLRNRQIKSINNYIPKGV